MAETPDKVAQAGGILTSLSMLATLTAEFTGSQSPAMLAAALCVAALACFCRSMACARLIFVAIGLALAGSAVVLRDDGVRAIMTGLGRAGFVVALFTALSVIRSAASRSPGIIACGRFLAHQRPADGAWR